MPRGILISSWKTLFDEMGRRFPLDMYIIRSSSLGQNQRAMGRRFPWRRSTCCQGVWLATRTNLKNHHHQPTARYNSTMFHTVKFRVLVSEETIKWTIYQLQNKPTREYRNSNTSFIRKKPLTWVGLKTATEKEQYHFPHSHQKPLVFHRYPSCKSNQNVIKIPERQFHIKTNKIQTNLYMMMRDMVFIWTKFSFLLYREMKSRDKLNNIAIKEQKHDKIITSIEVHYLQKHKTFKHTHCNHHNSNIIHLLSVNTSVNTYPYRECWN